MNIESSQERIGDSGEIGIIVMYRSGDDVAVLGFNSSLWLGYVNFSSVPILLLVFIEEYLWHLLNQCPCM